MGQAGCSGPSDLLRGRPLLPPGLSGPPPTCHPTGDRGGRPEAAAALSCTPGPPWVFAAGGWCCGSSYTPSVEHGSKPLGLALNTQHHPLSAAGKWKPDIQAEATEAPHELAWGHRASTEQHESQLCQMQKAGPPFSVGWESERDGLGSCALGPHNAAMRAAST